MGVRGTDRGGPPIAKSVEFLSVPGREGLHQLGQSLGIFFHFLLLFLDLGLDDGGGWGRVETWRAREHAQGG